MADRTVLVAGDERTDDRRPIVVDPHSPHAGIVASLRRAFAPASKARTDEQFAELLKKLN